MSAKVTIDRKANTMTVVIPLDKPRPSKSGRTMVVASSGGNVPTDCKYDGHVLTLGYNAYYKPDSPIPDDEDGDE